MDYSTLAMSMPARTDPKAHAGNVAKLLGITTTTLYMYVNGDRTPKEA